MGKSMHEKPRNLEAYYGLPQEVKFCAKCCYSNQRPSSQREINHTKDTKKVTLAFDKDGSRLCRHPRLGTRPVGNVYAVHAGVL